MKFTKVQFEGNGYTSVVAKATTALENRMLKELKYDLFSEIAEVCNWHPEMLGEDLAIRYANALGYSFVDFNGYDEYLVVLDHEGTYALTATPSNLECIIAGYRLLGKHRKVARILKKIKALGIQDMVSNMTPGHQ